MGFVRVCAVDDIPRRGARVVRRASGPPVAVFRTADDRVFALLDRCPHRGGPLSEGLVTGDRVVCPLHGWTIGLCDGNAFAPDEGCAQAFAVEVRDGDVYLSTPVVPAEAPSSVVPAKAGTQCRSPNVNDAGVPRSRERQA